MGWHDLLKDSTQLGILTVLLPGGQHPKAVRVLAMEPLEEGERDSSGRVFLAHYTTPLASSTHSTCASLKGSSAG